MSRRGSEKTISLADELSIRVGFMELVPSLREVKLQDQAVIIEPRVMQVLVVLAQAHGRTVSRDELVLRCWGGAAISEDAINRVMTRVRRIAALDGGQSFAVETVPRVGYRLRIVATPETPAMAPQRDFAVQAIRQAWPRRRMMLVGLAATGLLAAGVGAWRWRAGVGTRSRIAVLPFDTDSRAHRTLADGLADALIGALAAVPQIDVIARSSTFALRGADKARAAEMLEASYLVDGAVNGVAGDEAASVALIDWTSQTTVWSQRYPLAADSIAALRARIVRDTGAVLNLSVSSAGAAVISAEDFRAFLQGQGALLQDPPLPGEAIAALTGVTARAPGFSPGWTALAAAQLLAQGPLQPDTAVAPARAQARAAADRAITTGPRNANAHALLAAATDRQGRWQSIGALLDKALALEPANPQALYRAGSFYADVGANERAIDQLQRAWRLDPLNADAAFLLLRVLEAAGREDELDAFLGKARAMWRNDLGIWRFAACRAVWLRRFDEVGGLVAAPPAHAASEAAYFQDLVACARDPSSPVLSRFLAPLSGPLPKFWPISIFALGMIGKRDECLALIRRVFLSPNGRAQAPTWVLLQAILQPYWDDLEFRAVLQELGLFDYWRVLDMDPLRTNRTTPPIAKT